MKHTDFENIMVKSFKELNVIDKARRCETQDLIFELTPNEFSYNVIDKVTSQLLFEVEFSAYNPFDEEYETLYIMNMNPNFNLTGHKYHFSGEDIIQEDYDIFDDCHFEIYIC